MLLEFLVGSIFWKLYVLDSFLWWWYIYLANRLVVSSQISWLCFMITKLWRHSVVACTFLLGLAAVLLLVLLEECLKQIFVLGIEGLACATLIVVAKVCFICAFNFSCLRKYSSISSPSSDPWCILDVIENLWFEGPVIFTYVLLNWSDFNGYFTDKKWTFYSDFLIHCFSMLLVDQFLSFSH